jgi:hypothetical protein
MAIRLSVLNEDQQCDVQERGLGGAALERVRDFSAKSVPIGRPL